MEKPQLPPSKNELVPRLGSDASPGHLERSYGYGSLDAPESGSFLEYWEIFCRHKVALIVITLLGALTGVLVTLPQTSMYQARTTLEIQDLNENFLNIQQINPVSQSNRNAAPNDIQTQIKLLESDSLIKRVLVKLKDRIPADLRVTASHTSIWRKALNPALTLKDRIVTASGWYPSWRKAALSLTGVAGLRSSPKPDLSENQTSPSSTSQQNGEEFGINRTEEERSKQESGPEKDPLADVDVGRATGSLKVRAVPQTRVVEVSYDSADPHFAAAFLNTLDQEFIESNMEARWKMSEQTGQWLSRQLDEMRGRLERSEDALQSYARNTGLMFTSNKTPISEEKLRQLQEELSKAQADRIVMQSRWEITKTSLPDALPEVLSDTSLQSLQAKITELRRERAELITIYTEKHSKVNRVEAQIAPLEEALHLERSAIIDRLHNDYGAALGREKLLAVYYAAQSRLVTDQSEKAIQYNILNREVDSNRQVYETMLQRAKEASISSAMRASNVRIVDGAEAPKFPYKPSIPLNGGLGLLSGLFAGLGIVLVRERGNRTLQMPGESRFWLNVPELQVIPTAVREDTGRRFYTRAFNKTITLSLSSPQSPPPLPGATKLSYGGNGAAPFSVELVTWQQKPSLIADSFRSLLTSILFCGENGDRPRVLVLTSAGPGEGKTTVVSNLGIALAEIKRKVLIIDADLRKPRIHQLFDLPNLRGLSSLLGEESFAAEALEGIVQKTGIPGLFVLPSGPASESAVNLLYSQNLPLLLAKLKQEFDMVIIDTPPMLQMADARVLGRMADGVILVTRAGHTMRDAAVAASQRFAEDRIRILGTILNDWDPKKSQDRYGYGRYRYYQNS